MNSRSLDFVWPSRNQSHHRIAVMTPPLRKELSPSWEIRESISHDLCANWFRTNWFRK
jgi:hypothetical protein